MNDDQLMTMHNMLASCLNPDNDIRRQAEASITAHLNEHREVFIYGLIKLIRTSTAVQVRVLCAIILRQTLPQGDTALFTKLPDQLQQLIQTELIAAINNEPERYVRTQISDTVAALASVLIYNNKWPGLFEALYAMCQPTQTNDSLKVCALSILGKLNDAADNLLPQVAALHAVFVSTLQPTNSLLVRVEACVACCKIIDIIEEKAHTAEYQKFVPAFLSTLSDTLAPGGDEELAKRLLCGLTEVATEEGRFFQPHLAQLIPAMYAIGADTNKLDLDDGVRQYASEVLIATGESAPSMVRKNPAFIKHAILICLSLMLDVEEDPAWGQKNDTSDFYDNSNFDCGENNIDRLCLVVKGAKLWPILKPILESHLTNKVDWRYRHAGLCAMAQSAGVLELKNLPVKEIATFIRDEHPRVRWSAVQCLGQFPMDFEVRMQKTWHQVMFPALMAPLEDFANPRIQSHAASALLNMVDGCPARIVKLYLDPLMTALMALLKQSHQMVQDRVMPVMAGLAGQVPKAFTKYYDQVVPLMIYIIEHATTKETRMLRARAMESVSFIGMYVGREKFHNDAKHIVQLFLKITQEAQANGGQKKPITAATSAGAFADIASDDDYSERHMLDAWSRICACLKEEFVPILPYVMPSAFEAITRKDNEFTDARTGQVHRLVDEDGEDIDPDEYEPEDAHVSKDGVVKGISVSAGDDSSVVNDKPVLLHFTSHAHTAAMEEKATAMSMVIAFCFDLQEHFMPYVKQTAEIFIPLLDHHNDEVRANAVEAMPHLLRSAVLAHKKSQASTEFVKALFEAICARLLQALAKECAAEILAMMVIALQELVSEAGTLARDVIDATMLHTIGAALFKMLHESHDRMERREQLLREEETAGDMDEERIYEIESRNAAEDGLHSNTASLMESLIKSHKDAFLPTFDALFPEVQGMMSVNMPDSTKRIAISIVDDLFENLGPLAAKYFPATLEPMCMYASGMNEEHGLRQASAWGIHVAAKHCGAAFQPFIPEIAKRLVASIEADPTYLQREPQTPVGQEWIARSAEDEGEPTGEGGDEDEDAEAEGGEGDEEEGEYEDDDDDPDERSRHSCLDNLVSAIGAIAFYQNRPDLYPVWLNFLPIRCDSAEGPNVYNMLLDLIDANHPLVLGDNFANLPKLLSIFLAIVNTDFLKDAQLRARVAKFFQTVKAMPPAMLQQVVPHLHETLQQKLAAIMQSV